MPRTTVARRGRPEVTTFGAPADLEQALADLGIEVTGADDDEVKGRCPYHVTYLDREDGNPSWSVNRNTGYHSCFSCPGGGTFVVLVCDMLECGPFAAARWIKNYGLNIERVEALPEYETRQEIRKRSLVVVENDLARFSNPTKEALGVRSISVESALYYGILWNQQETEWVLPIRMPDGRLIGYQRKSEKRLGGTSRVKNWPPKMAKSTTLFGADTFPVGDPAVVLESPLDCARLYTAGIVGGVSTFGDKYSDEQMRVLRDLTDEVVFAMDNDAAGQASARMFRDGDVKTKRPAHSRRFRTRYLDYGKLPVGAKDIGEPDVADIHIMQAIRSAQHPLIADLGESVDVYRNSKAVSETGKGGDGRARKGTGGVRVRSRQDTANHRSRRGSGRRVW